MTPERYIQPVRENGYFPHNLTQNVPLRRQSIVPRQTQSVRSKILMRTSKTNFRPIFVDEIFDKENLSS